MRRLLLTLTLAALILCLLAQPCAAAWAHVQTQTAGEAGSDTDVTTGNFAAGITAGSAIVCAISFANNGGQTINTPTDTLGNTYVQIETTQTLGNFGFAAFYALNSGAGTNAVTVTFSAATTEKRIHCSEYSGLATSGALDQSDQEAQTDVGTGADAIATGIETTTANNELIWAATHHNFGSQTTSPGTSFTERSDAAQTFYTMATEDRNLATAGTVQGTFGGVDASTDAVTFVATFKEPAAGATCRGGLLLLGVGGC